MDGITIPYDVFRVDNPDSRVSDSEFIAYQLPDGESGGEVRVLTKNFGQPEISFASREKADVFLRGIKSQAGGQVVELNPQDYPAVLTSSISFDPYRVEGSKPQHRVEKEKPSDTQIQHSKSIEPVPISSEDRAITKDSNNNRPEQLQNNHYSGQSQPSNHERALDYNAGVMLSMGLPMLQTILQTPGLIGQISSGWQFGQYLASNTVVYVVSEPGSSEELEAAKNLHRLNPLYQLVEGWERTSESIADVNESQAQGRALTFEQGFEAGESAMELTSGVTGTLSLAVGGRGVGRFAATNILKSPLRGHVVLPFTSKSRGKSIQSLKIDQVLTKEQGKVIDHLQQKIFSQERHSAIGEMAAQMEGILSKQKSAISVALHLRARRELQMKFGPGVKVSAGPCDLGIPIGRAMKGGKLVTKHTIDLNVDTKSRGGVDRMGLELKRTAWIERNGEIGMPAMKIPGARNSKIQQIKAIEKSAIRNPNEPKLIVTPNNIIYFYPKTRKWIHLLR